MPLGRRYASDESATNDGKCSLMPMSAENLQQLQASLDRIDELIRAAAVRAQEAGHSPTDAMRGLIVSDDEIGSYLEQAALTGLWSEDGEAVELPVISLNDPDRPFVHLIRAFGLDALDSYILLLCLATELDRRYERLYAYLQDDVTQRRPTVNLMMNLLGSNVPQRFQIWERLLPDRPLRKFQLVLIEPDPTQRSPVFLASQIKVDHRVVAYLLGDASPDERLRGSLRSQPCGAVARLPARILDPIRAVMPQAPMVYMHGKKDQGQCETAAVLCDELGVALVSLDLPHMMALDTHFDLAWQLALREAYLLNAALYVDGWEACLNDEREAPAQFWSALMAYPYPVFLRGKDDWEPRDVHRSRRLLRVTFTTPSFPERLRAWEDLTQLGAVDADGAALEELASKFHFTHHQIARAVQTAADLAVSRGASLNAHDLLVGAQAQAGLRLGHLAKRIIPRMDWNDLVLPPDQIEQLQEMTARARFSHIVYEDWGYHKKTAHARGVSALFAGESGTGKTMSAQVIARDLGLVMYKIDLSAVVSKYIGETEKNLSVIFSEAQSSNAILFFDEADALFGKRSEVKDARDRYANIEVAYLLQQIEEYDGIAILASNLRQNLDEAFTRRLDFLVDFPFPEAEYRRLIWEGHFPAEAPLSPEVDLDELAERYHLAGGNIQNVAVAAAYLAASDGGVILPAHIRRAIRREHQKMGRLLDDQ